MMNTIAEITQQLWKPANSLCQEGIPYHAYLTDLTWLLFLKIAPVYASHLPDHLTWEALIQKKGGEQYQYYQKLIKEMGNVSDPHIAGIYAHACSSLKKTQQLAQLISALAVIDVVPTNDLGEIYERLLEKCACEDENSLHMIPRSLIDLMVVLTQPQLGELIQDPLAGTAIFVVAADQYIKVTNNELSDININQKQRFIAIEPNLERQRLALMNCFLHNIVHPQQVAMRLGDSLLSNLQLWPLADLILSVLVFASDPTDKFGKHDASLALLKHIYYTLKPGGRAAVVLPDKILGMVGPAQQLRRLLLDSCVVHTVLRLPNGIFYPYHGRAHLLFFRKGKTPNEKTQKVWFYDLRTRCPIFGQELHLTREHLMEFEMVYGDDPLGENSRNDDGENERWRSFSRQSLAEQEDRLDLCWLQDKGMDRLVVSGEIGEMLGDTVTELRTLTDILG